MVEVDIKISKPVYVRRTEGIIGLAGFTRLDQRILGEALCRCTAGHIEWMACEEIESGKPILRYYVEDTGALHPDVLAEEINGRLKELDAGYRGLDTLLGLGQVRVALLAPRTFARYYAIRKRTTGQVKESMSRVNPDSSLVDTLLTVSTRAQRSQNEALG